MFFKNEEEENEYYKNLYKPAHEKEHIITSPEVSEFVNGFKGLVNSGADDRELAIYALKEMNKLPSTGPMG